MPQENPAWEPLGGEVGAWVPSHDGSWSDQVGSNDSTPSGGVAINLDRQRGGVYAGEFDGSGLVSLTSEVQYAGDFTIHLKRKAASGILFGSALVEESLQQLNATTIRCAFGTNADFTVPTNAGGWNAITLTRIGGTLRLYYDGTESSTAGIANADTIKLGRLAGDAIGGSLVGSLDDIRHWSTGLHPAQIAELYKRNYQRRLNIGNPVFAMSVSRNKHYEGGTGGFYPDISGNANDSTLVDRFFVINDSGSGGRKAFDATSPLADVITGYYPSGTKLIVHYWIKTTQNSFTHLVGPSSGSHRCIFLGQNGSGHGATAFSQSSSPGGWTLLQGSFPIGDGNWHHVAGLCDCDTGEMELWIDGAIDTSTSHSLADINTPDPGFPVVLGNGWQSSPICQCDDFQIHHHTDRNWIRLMSGSRDAEYVETDPNLKLCFHPTHDLWGQRVGNEALDLTLNDNNGTLTAGLVYDTTNKDNGGEAAFDFGTNGDGRYLATNVSSDLTPDLEFTAMWWMLKTVDDQWQMICQHNDGALDNGWRIGISGNPANLNQVVFSFGGVADYFMPAIIPQANVWQHVAVTLKGTDLYGYLNGVQSPLYGALASPTGTRSAFTVGAYNNGSNPDAFSLSGLLNNFRLYDRALFHEEIKRHYDLTRWGREETYNELNGTGQSAEAAALQAGWMLQETSGTNLADRSSNENDATYDTTITSTAGPTPYLANAVSFTGANEASLASELNLGDFTIWCRLSALASNATQQALLGQNTDNHRVTVEKGAGAELRVATSSTDRLYGTFTAQDGFQSFLISRGRGEAQTLVDGGTWERRASPEATALGPLELIGRGGSLYNESPTAELLAFDFGLYESQGRELDAGPEAILTGTEPTINGTPQVGTEIGITPGTWGIDPEFAGANGTTQFTVYWYLQNDAAGSGRDATPVAVTAHPAGYTPVEADEGRFLVARVVGYNSGGYDTLETWWTPAVEVQPDAGGATLIAESGRLEVSGSDVAFARTVALDAEFGRLEITGSDATLTYLSQVVLTAERGRFEITGSEVSLSRTVRLDAEAGRLELTGSDVDFSLALSLQAVTGRIEITGSDATLTKIEGNTLVAARGRFEISGTQTALIASNQLVAESGRLEISGSEAQFSVVKALAAETGNFTITGSDVTLTATNRLIVEPGTLEFRGLAVQLIYSEAGTTAGIICIKDGKIGTGRSAGYIRTGHSTASINCCE